MSLIGKRQFLATGTDSPVSILSLTMHCPDKRTRSQGKTH